LSVSALLLAALPLVVDNLYIIGVIATVGLYIILALGLNVVAGYAGLLDLGYVAFYGIGAYTYALLASHQFNIHLSYWLVLPIAACLTAIFGALLGAPVLRLRGDYLAIVTLGFGEIIRIFFNNMDGRNFPINVTNGPNGIVGLDPVSVPLLGLTLETSRDYYYLIFVLAAVFLTASAFLSRSAIGRAWAAIREDELAARTMGIPTVRYKLLAFATGAFMAGAAGATFAAWRGAAFPNSFTAVETVNVFAMIVLGGLGSIPGVVVGATALVIIPEVLRDYSIYRWILYGAMLVLMMRFRPQGLLGSPQRRRELKPVDPQVREQEDSVPWEIERK
jgi:branched-chain amino acid transport system permease protein